MDPESLGKIVGAAIGIPVLYLLQEGKSSEDGEEENTKGENSDTQ